MTEEVKPALSAKDWARVLDEESDDFVLRFEDPRENNHLQLWIQTDGQGEIGLRQTMDLPPALIPSGKLSVVIHAIGREQCHALAALALYGQPWGFTHEMVDELKELAEFWSGFMRSEPSDAYQAIERIKALLPPRVRTEENG